MLTLETLTNWVSINSLTWPRKNSRADILWTSLLPLLRTSLLLILLLRILPLLLTGLMSKTFSPLLRTKVNAVHVGLSQQLVCLKVFTTWTTSNKLVPTVLLNNSLLIVVVLWVTDVKVAVVLGLLMLFPMSKITVLFRKLNTLTMLKTMLVKLNFKILVTSLVNNSKLLLVMPTYVKLLLNNPSPFVLMHLFGTLTILVSSTTVALVLLLLTTLFFWLVMMPITTGLSETLGVLLGVMLAILP